jgi:hypothetical protein
MTHKMEMIATSHLMRTESADGVGAALAVTSAL